MTTLPTLQTLLIDELKDLYHAEKQLVEALPKMAEAATKLELQEDFKQHLLETHGHVERLEQAFDLLGLSAEGTPCHAMEGLLAEGDEAINLEPPGAVRDAALIGAAQRVEHYEMAGYGTARAFAHALGAKALAGLLQMNLDEETATNKKLGQLAATVNSEAHTPGEPVSAK